MPRTDFGPEVKASMPGNPNTPAKVRPPSPRAPTSPGQQVAESGRDSSGNPGIPPRAPGPGRGGMPGMGRGSGMPMPIAIGPGGTGAVGAPDAHHVAAATSIAHAILGNRGLR